MSSAEKSLKAEGQKRNHPIAVITSIMRTMKSLIVVFLVVILKKPIYGAFAILGALIIFGIYEFLNWKNTYFYIEEGNLIYRSGVFSEKRKVIPLEKIVTVDFSQSIISSIFGLYRVKLDTGSKDATSAELNIHLKVEEAEELRQAIFKDSHKSIESNEGVQDIQEQTNVTEEKGKRFIMSTKDLSLTAITGNFLLLGLGMFWGLYAFLDDVIDGLKLKVNLVGNAEKYVETAAKSDVLGMIGAILIILIPFALLALVISVVGTNFRYYNFSLWRNGQKVHIEYGLFNKKKYTLPVDGINAVTLKQSFLRRLLGLNAILASSSGYGDEEKEEALLFPLANEKLTNEILLEILPDTVFDGELKRPPRRVAPMFFTKPMGIYALFILFGTGINRNVAFGLLALPFIAFANYLEYKNTGIGYDGTKLAMAYGAFSYKKVIIPFEKVQVLSKRVSIFQKRKHVSTYIVEFCGGKLVESAKVKHLEASYFSEIAELQASQS